MKLMVQKIILLAFLFQLSGKLFGEYTFESDPTGGLNPLKIDLPSKEGTILGLSGKTVTGGGMGTARYSYQIPLPKWRDLFAGLSVNYDSSGGNGILGQGFKLSIPFIKRSVQWGVPDSSTPLISSLDGELAKAPNGTYRARIERKFSIYKELEKGFMLEKGDGLKLYFGTTTLSRQETSEFVNAWYLERVEDLFGNAVVISYRKNEGENLPMLESMKYLENDGTVSFYFLFSYEKRSDVWTSYLGGLPLTYSQRLKKVEGYRTHYQGQSSVGFNPDPSKRIFKIDFQYREEGPSNRSLLTQISRFGTTDEEAVPSIRLNYSPLSFNEEEQEIDVDELSQDYYFGRGNNVPTFLKGTYKMLDMNSDGLVDIVATRLGRVYPEEPPWDIWINKGKNGEFHSPRKLLVQQVGFKHKSSQLLDLDGDRRIDYIKGTDTIWLNDAEKGEWGKRIHSDDLGGTLDSSWYTPGKGIWVDLNGDGKSDFISYVYQTGDYPMMVIFWNRSDKNGLKFDAPQRFIGKENVPLIYTKRRHELLNWTDVNGDSLPDICAIIDQNLTCNINLGNGRFISNLTKYSIEDFDQIRHRRKRNPAFVDVNQDGLPDIVFRSEKSVDIFFNTGKDFKLKRLKFTDERPDFKRIELGDVNGNGSKDLIIPFLRSLKVIDPYLKKDVKAPYLLVSVDNGIGSTKSFSYTPSNDFDISNSGKIPTIYQTVSGVVETSPSLDTEGQYKCKVTSHRSYRYGGGAFDNWRNEFLGFEKVEETVAHKHKKTENHSQECSSGEIEQGKVSLLTYYASQKDALLKGALKSIKETDFKSGRLLREVDNSWSIRELWEDTAWYPIVDSTIEKVYEQDGSVRKKKSSWSRVLSSAHKLPVSSTKKEYGKDGTIYRSILTKYKLYNGQETYIGKPDTLLLYKGDSEATDAINRIVLGRKYKWTNEGRLEIESHGKPENWQNIHTYEYDSHGNLSAALDGLENKTKLFYRNLGNFLPTEVRTLAGTGGTDLVKYYRYHPVLGKIEQVYNWGQSLDKTVFTEYSWDGLGRLISYKPATTSSPTISFNYKWGDGLNPGRIEKHLAGRSRPYYSYYDGIQRKIADYVPTTNGYMLNGLRSYESHGGAVVTGSSIPHEGIFNTLNPFSSLSTRAKSLLTETIFDRRLRPIEIRYPNGGVARNSYSAYSKLETNTESEPKLYLMDYFGRTCAIEEWNTDKPQPTALPGRGCSALPEITDNSNPLVSRLEIGYGAADEVVWIRNKGEPARSYNYDIFGRKTSFSAPNLGSIEWIHNELGLVHTKIERDISGKAISTIFSKYDFMGRETERRSLMGVAGNVERDFHKGAVEYEFVYDQLNEESDKDANRMGRIARLKMPDSSYITYGYDEEGNETSQTLFHEGDKVAMTFGWTDLGELKWINYPDGERFTNIYSDVSGLLSYQNGSLFKTDILYDEQNGMNKVAISSINNSLIARQSFGYDFLTRLPNWHKVEAKGNILGEYFYSEYDYEGRLKLFEGQDTIASSIKKSISYDQRGRISNADYDLVPHGGSPLSKSLGYTFTPSGDALKMGNESVSYKRGADGDLLEMNMASKKWKYGAFGRLKSLTGVNKVDWSAQGRISSMKLKDGSSLELQYFPNGSRFLEKKSVGNEKKSRVFMNRWLEYDPVLKSYKKYYYAGDSKLAVKNGDEGVLFLVNDNIGSTRMTINSQGAISSYRESLPYGGAMYETGSDNSHRYKFAGALSDESSPLMQMKARYYSPDLGRFISPDPLFLERPELCMNSSIECNIYSYAKNNPLKYIDQTGKFAIFGGAIGGALGAGGAALGEYLSNPDWTPQSVRSAAYGGGVTGAIMGSGIGAATSLVAAVGIGAVGGVAGNIVEQASRVSNGLQDSFSGRSLGVGLAGGMAGGAVAKGVTHVALRGMSSRANSLMSSGRQSLSNSNGLSSMADDLMSSTRGDISLIKSMADDFNNVASRAFEKGNSSIIRAESLQSTMNNISIGTESVGSKMGDNYFNNELFPSE